MPKCTRQGCQKEFEEDKNEEGACMHHSGRPVFHEGLKSWSCCEDVNRPVLDFESFMVIPGCTPGKHTATTNLPVPKPVQTSGGPGSNLSSTPAPRSVQTNAAGQEVFSTGAISNTPTLTQTPSAPTPAPPPPEDEDDPSVPVEPGVKCLRNGCKHLFVSDETSRGEGEESKCVYHPMQPIFHEGSKGYLCCKRRVLEFDEFLKIEGCKSGKHLFVKKKRGDEGEASQEEMVTCRIDHYQTPTQVLASVYAKKVDPGRSSIVFEDERLHLDLFMPPVDPSSNAAWKRFRKTVELYGRVKGEECKYAIKGTKVDLTLVKQDSRSWNLLERTDADLAGFTLTFGVGGRTGTVGSKTPILDQDNQAKQ